MDIPPASHPQAAAKAEEATAAAPPARETSASWLSGWVCLLVTVFLAGATLNCLLRWLPYAYPWDLGGTILSGLLTWLAYAWTLSDRSTIPGEKRGTVALTLWVLWAVTFPAVLWSLGFK
ncbi:MAG: hypothetical protein OZSIB_2496 [Candidatus Ozemobacter sibiricus]|jgi:hypothetical protein|uniref:Uncharacterized protein n=1 Tax=Candidatus Ozemobacter sibiricus TaxID=2268124 RepID=A0A367ZTT9_9BACT|nr:MAG: hypothetical protein OZSIB_2496 [Candidatus Ozemobacter sibiricus]